MHVTALQLRAQRMTVLASNIANVDTPDYKARDLDFKSVMQATSSSDLSTSHHQHFSIASMGLHDELIKYRMPYGAALDGNTVEIGTENSLFTENAMRYQATTTFLNSRIKGIMTALRGQ